MTRGMLRLVKLTRLSRVTRLLRSVPELAIIVPLARMRSLDACEMGEGLGAGMGSPSDP